MKGLYYFKYMNYVYEKRTSSIDIVEYLKNSFHEINPLDYFVEDELDLTELKMALGEDLPLSRKAKGRSLFIRDILNICNSFFILSSSKNIRIQIQIVSTDMCRLFHVDNLRQRLLCTYLGPGTQWTDDSNINREGLGKGDNQKVIKDFDKIKQAQNFDVLILRGERFDSKISGVVHRSPPIKQERLKRILLKIDEL